MALLINVIILTFFWTPISSRSYGMDVRFTNITQLPSLESSSKQRTAFIEIDESDRHSLIYGVRYTSPRLWSVLYHYNMSSGNTTILAGNETEGDKNIVSNGTDAHFTYMSVGAQINETHIVLPEKRNNCLRLFDRSEGIVSVLMGPCTEYHVSVVSAYKVSQPSHVVVAPSGDRIFVVNAGNFVIGSLHLLTGSYKPMFRQMFEQGMPQKLSDLFLSADGSVAYLALYTGADAGLYTVQLPDHLRITTVQPLRKNLTKLLSVDSSSTDLTGPLNASPYQQEGLNPSASRPAVSITDIDQMEWLIKDETIIIRDPKKLIYRLVDLRQNIMTSWCHKKESWTLSQIESNIDECVKFDGGEFTIDYETQTAYLTGIANEAVNGSKSIYFINMHRIDFYRLKCDSSYLTYADSIVVNNVSSTELLTQLEFDCEEGWALKEDYNTVQCVASQDSLHWSLPFPTCQLVDLNLYKVDIYPSSGHIRGGYNVSLVGFLPYKYNVSVRFPKLQTDVPVERRSRREVSFTVPDFTRLASGTTKQEVQIELTLANSSKILNFTYTPSPTLQNSTIVYSTIRTGLTYAVEYKFKTEYNYTYQVKLLGKYLDCSHAVTYLDEVYDETAIKCLINHAENIERTDQKLEVLVDSSPLISKSVTLRQSPEIQNVEVITRNGLKTVNDFSLHVNITGLRLLPESSYYAITLTKPPLLNYSESSHPADDSVLPPHDNRFKRELSYRDPVCNIPYINNWYMEVECFPVRDAGSLNLQIDFGGTKLYSEIIKVDELRTGEFKQDDSMDTVIIIACTVVVSVLMIIGGSAVGYYCYRKKQKGKPTAPFNMLVNSAYFTRTPDSSLAVEFNVIIQTKICHMLIPPSKITYKKQDCIGQGCFGSVLKGTYYSDHGVIDVALKTLNAECCSAAAISRFCEEASIMFHFNHPHVLSNIGVVDEGARCPLVVLPYMSNRDLRALLLNEQLRFTQGDLVHFGLQIAKGMEYLSNKQFVHRDLATRNCLVTEDYVIKIADFGLSRDIYRHEYYKMGEKSETPLPVKWMAIESLERGVFTSSSDVWSFGVVLWELMTRGAQPYAHLTNGEAINHVRQGLRLPRPDNCFENLYDLMRSCWFVDPAKRPSFSLLVTYLRGALYGCNIEKGDYVRVLTKNLTDLSLALTRAVSEHGLNSLSIQADKKLKNVKLAPLIIPVANDKKNKSKPFPFGRQLSYSYSDTDLLLQASPGSSLPETPKMV